MNKSLYLAVFFSLVALVGAHAGLSIIGQKSMLQTIVAENEGKGIIGIGGYGQYWQSQIDLVTLTSDYKQGFGNYFVSYVPYSFLEVFVAQAAGAWQQDQPKERTVGIGDTYFGAKYSNKLRGFAQWGLYSAVRMPTGEQDFGLGTTAFENDLLLSLDLTRYDVTPFKLHFNLGFIKTGESDPVSYEESDQLVIHAAIALPSHIFSPSLEYSTYQAQQLEGLSFSENPIFLTPGLAFQLPYGFSFQFGVDVPISKFKPFKRRAVASASWVIPLRELLKPFGARTLYGQVIDSETDLPVGEAKIMVINADMPARYSDTQTGTFKYTNLPDDFSTIMITKDGYKRHVKVVQVPKGKDISLQFKISPLKEGTVSGRVIDRFSSAAVTASISLSGDDEIFTTKPDGAFSVSVEEGITEITFKNNEYETYRTPVTVKKGEEFFILVKLRPLVKHDILIGTIHFESNKAVITEQTEEIFNKALNYMRENPGVKIEVGGHTDNTGGEQMNLDLSKIRAESVREHILSRYGVNPDKVIAKGYGEWVPVATNDTAKGRQQNRRVEIKIIWAD
jgi:outer membrane protein OmpA-like peptidoglycan-associated protein